ncbi:citrate lyase subunit beta / citryl-CoA lyase [Amycolatopsis arida]|uniref:Citrate lyase subunit beta / citryl-CoA lyase n=1 Tax=Amycolatopsis arida TaxID=587909 RepID=A0A1I5PX17_9PSEU|nr:CoA ester lyase [Amycolatopsis arida]TDX98634.1 citrate lyase subunit beta/citryl-CoA lyase [Amycolatopsis arida]SFP38477.1 citrate lyase subunit beta / citryl-CoA lyase [Amycolatopsis arida]
MNPADSARSLLVVPGDRPERFAKAAASGADVVLCDLEDAVAPANRDAARAVVADWVARHPAAVRINAAPPERDADLAALAGANGLLAVVLPKAEDPAELRAVAARLPPTVSLHAMVETARGIRDVDALAEAGPRRLVFGTVDFGLDAGILPADAEERELLYARSRLVIASRAAGLAPPVDGVSERASELLNTVALDLDDSAAAGAAARRARHLGFGGKLCPHPRQVGPVNAAFRPTERELRWARRVLDAAAGAGAGGGGVRVDGELIDRPRLTLARRLLETHEEHAAALESRHDHDCGGVGEVGAPG